MTILIFLTCVSLGMFIGLNVRSIKNFGMLECYSGYGEKWGDKIESTVNVWGLLTILCALLMVPEMIELGENNPWQFLGFVAPLYLIMVGATPNYKNSIKEWIIHSIGALLSGICGILWLFLIVKCYMVIIIILSLNILLMLITETKQNWLYWLEITVYATIYFVLIFMPYVNL